MTLIIILGVIGLAFFLPTIVAFMRGHEYRWIIFLINVAAAWTGLGWLIIAVWAIRPSNRAIADPLVDNATGLKKYRAIRPSPYKNIEFPDIEGLHKLDRLYHSGRIAESEYLALKKKLL